MTEATHANLALLQRLDLSDLDSCASIVAENFVWHYFNPMLPELEGDYHGIEGLKRFFAELGEKSSGSFRVNVIDARPAGDELIVTQVRNSMTLDGDAFEVDAVVVWRIVADKVAEGWDIPAVNTVRASRTA